MLQKEKNEEILDRLLDWLWGASPHNKDKIQEQVKNKIIEIYATRPKEKN